ncbi:MAG: DNA-protecting protein DprA [Leptospiraceae bacterium]|nr:DNA-protecting protein DprA [Leptospiraceae bacterium]
MIFLLSISRIANFARNRKIIEDSKTIEELIKKIIDYLPKTELLKHLPVCEYTKELIERDSISIIHYFEKDYPDLLRNISDPPLILFYKGNRNLFQIEKTSVVGTRKPSRLSRFAANKIPELLSKDKNIAIVSGMAMGIDREVMLSSIEKNIPTIGVLGTGINIEYPYINKDLYEKMKSSDNTLIISEMRPDEKYGKWSFPKRNRIITGLSNLLVVMEAPKKSGAISSANHAISQFREILVFDHKSLFNNEGGRKLLEDGAKPITLDDITKKKNSITHISEFLADSKNIPKILSGLGKLESEGLLKDMGGGYYLNLGKT